MISVSKSSEGPIRKVRCSAEAWGILKRIFQAVSEAAVNTKLRMLQRIWLNKPKKVIEYTDKVKKLVSDL